MINIAIQAAKSAGEIIRTNFSGSALPKVTYKDANNIVTETDIAVEKAIFNILKTAFPDHGFFSEEAGAAASTSEYLWVIDPLDGTSNFAHHIPFVCVSIALFKDKQPVLGVIYDPIHDELFTAETGKGSHLNGKAITPTSPKTLRESVVGLGRGSSQQSKERHLQIYQHIISKTRTTRVLGSAALGIVYAACGRFDGMIINDCNFYDCAAADIIAREAGAMVTDFQGKELAHQTEGISDILTTTRNLQQEIITMLGE